MAERRMFAKTIIDSDAFLDMPLSTQALYFHLSMRADDDGFVNNPKKIIKILGAGDDEYKVLLAKKFILGFETGVIVIKHWKIHNYIQKDRYKGTNYHEELARLVIDKNNGYTLDTDCVQDGDAGKVRLELGKVSKEDDKSSCDDYFQDEYACLEDAQLISSYLLQMIVKHKPTFKKPTLSAFGKWVSEIDKAIRIDNRTKEQLLNCINWIYSDKGSFWIPNIQSGKKLREKFDTMDAQMMRRPLTTKPQNLADTYRQLAGGNKAKTIEGETV